MSLGTAITLGVLAVPSLSRAQVSLDVLHAFAGGTADGADPRAALVQATDGALYGTTSRGGLTCFGGATCGTVFKITTAGDFTLMHRFNMDDGREPLAALVDDGSGRLWGTTSGNQAYGEVFSMTRDGSVRLETVFFAVDDLANPDAEVIQASDGKWYGTTFAGGSFRMPLGGVYSAVGFGIPHRIVHEFSGPDGGRPSAALIEASDGNLYGTTSIGGDFDLGTIFLMTLSDDHTVTVVHSFSGDDGSHPERALIQASDGNIYGTTVDGGDFDQGTVFQLTPDGSFMVLYSFSGPDGANPRASLIQGSDGNLYGTTANGGDFDQGVVFQMTLDGTFSTIYVFAGDSDGGHPFAALIQADDGNFYGTTSSGGDSGMGTVFRLNTALH
jgi:uncharacterized repeat protein (TIGR03803 family)